MRATGAEIGRSRDEVWAAELAHREMFQSLEPHTHGFSAEATRDQLFTDYDGDLGWVERSVGRKQLATAGFVQFVFSDDERTIGIL